MHSPLAIDLFTGLHGWSDGLVAEGFEVVGFDLEDMCGQFGVARPNGVHLVLQDVLTLHGKQFKDAALIVASPPCQEYSYMAMPWSRAKAIAAEYRSGKRDVADLTRLFDACFRIQREASEAAGHHIPLVVENVRGAIPWVGRSQANYGSFHLWGNVASVGNRIYATDHRGMPIGNKLIAGKASKVPGFRFDGSGRSFQSEAVKTVGHANKRDGHSHTRHLTNQAESDAVKCGPAYRCNCSGWGTAQYTGSKSKARKARKAASAAIAKIPLPLARHIARVYRPTIDDDAQQARGAGSHDL